MAYVGRSPRYGFLEGQTATFNGSTTVVTLQRNVSSTDAIDVFIDNVHQEPDVAYTLSSGGNSITFTGTPDNGAVLYIRFHGIAFDTARAYRLVNSDEGSSLTLGNDDTLTLSLDGTTALTATSSGITIPNLTVTGTTTSVNSTNLEIGDNKITLNSDVASDAAPTENAGIVINRGSSADVQFLWNETNDEWYAGNDLATGGIFRVKGGGTTPTLSGSTLAAFTRSAATNNASIAIIGNSGGYSSVHFGDENDEDVGQLNYSHTADTFALNKGLGVTGNITVSGTVDGVDIATRDGILTSTTTTAGAALPKAGGTMTGNLEVPRLGIGAAPASGYGDFQLRGSFAYINEDGSNTKQIYLRSDLGGNGPAIQVATAHPLRLVTDNVWRLEVQSTGDVNLNSGTNLKVNGTTVIDSSRNGSFADLEFTGSLTHPWTNSDVISIGVAQRGGNIFNTGQNLLQVMGADAYIGSQAMAGGDLLLRGGFAVDNAGLSVYPGDVTIRGGVPHSGTDGNGGKIYLQTGGTSENRLTIRGDGNIGVGMAGSSSAKFTIQGKAGTSGNSITDKTLHVIEGGWNDGPTFQVSDSSGVSRFQVDGTGRVGIGGTPTGIASYSTGQLELASNDGGILVLKDSNTTTDKRIKFIAGKGTATRFGRANDAGAVLSDTDLVIESTGKVGVGLVPSVKFQVEGTASGNWISVIENTHATNGSGLKVKAGDDSNTQTFGAYDKDNNQLMVVRSDGNVGINVSAPEHKLHVKSTSHDEPIALFEADTNGGGDVSVRLEGGGTGNPDEIYVEFSDRADPTNSFAIGLDDDASKLFLGYGALGTMNGHTQMVLQSDGKVGVNKTAPTSHLDVGADYTTNEGLFSVQRAGGYRFHRFNGSSGGATKTVTVNIKDYGLNAVEIIAHVTGHKYNSGPNAFAVKMVHVAMEESGNMRINSDRTADLGYRIGNQQSKVGTMSVSSGSGGNLYATFTVHGEYDTRILMDVKGAGFNYIASIAHS